MLVDIMMEGWWKVGGQIALRLKLARRPNHTQLQSFL
jgi:hypothetical protein